MNTQGQLSLGDPKDKQDLRKPAAKYASNLKPSTGTLNDRDDRNVPADWLGLATDHRRLFGASQEGWIRPQNSGGFLLGWRSFLAEVDVSITSNAIPVRLTFDADKLPLLPGAWKDIEETAESSEKMRRSKMAIQWLAPIPLYAVSKIEVPSSEQRARLLAMAGQFANVSLPASGVVVSNFEECLQPPDMPEDSDASLLELPENLNAVQGAMAMAVWAVPRIDPWIEFLCQAFAQDSEGVSRNLSRLNAQWLRIPWLDNKEDPAGNDQQALWRAALSSMNWPVAEQKSPLELARQIAQEACSLGANQSAEPWLGHTRRILSAEEKITCDGWRKNAAGLAIRLALLRPEPTNFKTWSKDLPGLSPSVWWAAAILCGWRYGYRALDNQFRGDPKLQEFFLTRALAVSWQGDQSRALTTSRQSALEHRRDERGFSLTWGGETVLQKPWNTRARWYNADLTDSAIRNDAEALARNLGWTCFKRRLVLPEGRIRIIGEGELSIQGQFVAVKGEVSLEPLRNMEIVERLDHEEFRNHIAIEAGLVRDPPPNAAREFAQELPGFIYTTDFITEHEETKLLTCIDQEEWSDALRRRVQHYGWRYDYKQRRIDKTMYLGRLPAWADQLAQRLVEEKLMAVLPDQVIVNEYLGNQGISRHIDQPQIFAEHVAMISLLETWGMVFRRSGARVKVEKPLARRSVAVLTGDSRYKWTHEIPKRKTEPTETGKRISRKRRVSLTFRKVLAEDLSSSAG